MTTSNDPNKTSGIANRAVKSLSYPLNETLATACRMQFVAYSRDTPSANASEDVKALISLPIPYSMPDNANFAIPSLNLGRLGAIDTGPLMNATGMADLAKTALDKGMSAVQTEIDNFQAANKTSALRALALSPLAERVPLVSGDAIRHLAGLVENPHTTIMFEGVNLRSYTLTWRLSPRSEEESEIIRQIVETIKLRTHPEEIFARVALDYPDLVYVNFTGAPAKFLPKYHRSIVTNIMYNPTTGNGATFFKNGAPTEIELTLSFQEVRILTRNLLREDYGVSE